MGNVAEQTSPLSVPVVRILVIGDAYQQKCKSFQPDDTSVGSWKRDLLFGAHFEIMGIAIRDASVSKRQPPTVN